EFLRANTLASRIVQPSTSPSWRAASIAARFATGSAPGSPKHTGHTFEFGDAPNSAGHSQNILLRVASWMWHSRPITASWAMETPFRAHGPGARPRRAPRVRAPPEA